MEELEDERADGRFVDAEESGDAVALEELAVGVEVLGVGAVAQRGHHELVRFGGVGEARDVALDEEKAACDACVGGTWAIAAIVGLGRQRRN